MSLRRFALLVLVAVACQPSVPSQSPPSTVAYAVSFPSSADATGAFSPPTPNDLVLESANSLAPSATLPAAQIALLKAFVQGGGWPNDQEVPIQIQFFAVTVSPTGGAPTAAPFPDIDTTTITPSTLALLRYDPNVAKPTPIAFEVAPTDYDAATGVLTIHKTVDPTTGTRWWPTGPNGPGRYVVALRGGSNGVLTKGGQQIAPQVSTFLMAQDEVLTEAQNQGLLSTQPNPALLAEQLEALRQLFANPVGWTTVPATATTPSAWEPGPPPTGLVAPLAAIDTVFPHRQIASLQTFVVDASAHVALDPASGVVPLPSEFLMQADYYQNPLAGHVQDIPAFGALAQGLASLNGFSTTALIMAPTSGAPVAAASVTDASVILLENNAGTWVQVKDFTPSQPTGVYLTEPPPITIDQATGQPCVAGASGYPATCVAELIGLQPAVTVPLGSAGFRGLPPLADHTQYAVLVTSDVKDVTGKPITPGTVAKILAIAQTTPVVDGNGHSLLAGVSDANAQAIQGLASVIPAEDSALISGAVASGAIPATTAGKVVFAYTFPTQTIVAQAQQLAAVPAASIPAANQPLVVTATLTPAQAAQKYGVPQELFLNPQNGQPTVAHFVEAMLVTLDDLDPATGAFRTSTAPVASPIPVLIAVPPTPPATGAPIVLFRHGINGGRAQMLPIAGALAGSGMLVAAIDAAKFGDRSWCSSAVPGECAAGSTCNTSVFGNQGDPATALPGLCTIGLTATPGQLTEAPVLGSLPPCSATVTSDCWNGEGGVAKASGNFFVSGNLFRMRDTMRQDIIDEVALVQALRATPVASLGVSALDPNNVFFVGQSLGSISGVADIAASGVFTRAVLNAGGGTFVDIATNSPAFQPELGAVTTSLGFTPGTSAYLEFLQVAKWVIDPADPVNFAPLLKAASILGQAARCDNVVPNTQNELFYGLIGLVGLSPDNPTATEGTATLEWYMADSTTPCPTNGTTGQGATHGFLLDGVNPSLTIQAQTNAAQFLLTGIPPATTPVLPLP